MTRASTWLLALLCACGTTSTHGGGTPDSGSPDGGGAADGGAQSDGGVISLIPEVKIKSVFPATGSTLGGGTILVSGSGFVQGFALRGGGDVSKRTTVKFAAALASDVNVIDDNRVEVTLPPGAPGNADVAVTNPNGTGLCAGCFRYIAPVKILSVDPASGPTRGGTAVTIHGTGLAPGVLVTIGGSELLQQQRVDAQTVTGLTPPGQPGGADVLALTPDGQGELRRGFVYRDETRVLSVSPSVSPTAGGIKLSITGQGFLPGSLVKLDGALAPSAWVSDGELEVIAPAHAAGAVDVSVDAFTLPRGLVYSDPGALALYALSPARGPVSGGIAVHVLGAGLSAADLQVTIGGAPATLAAQPSDNEAVVILPAAAAPGAVDVTVQAGGASQTLSQGFLYDARFGLTSVAPGEAPASGAPAVQLTISGAGLDQATLYVGALPCLAPQGGGSSVACTAPAGAPGLADILAVLPDGREARLSGNFRFTTPLALSQLSPAQGAQAGGTRISLFGRGFDATLRVQIGGRDVTALTVLSATEASCLTPPGTTGPKTVTLTQGASTATLAAAFTYFDPASSLGGGTGGPLLGVLNVTVLEGSAYKDGGVANARVDVVLHDGAPLSALTDLNGQVTFSDPRLVLPAQVTASKAAYDAITVDGVETQNLTVVISGPAGPPPPPPDPPPPPPTPLQPASVAGHVFGFKLAPGTVLSTTQRAVARVAIARTGIYALPPFASPPQFVTVTSDGGGFTFDKLYSLSPTTFYAVFGIEDSSVTPPSFEPLLLGTRRGVQPDPANSISNADIILDTHLDQTVDVIIDSPPSVTAGHDAFIDLDLGSAGAIPIDRVTMQGDPYHLHFRHLPLAAGQGFVFVEQMGRWTGSGITTPVSTYLRRVFGDLTGGITLGPLLPFPVMQPIANPFDGKLSWVTAPSALQPNLQQLQIEDSNGGQDTSWAALYPGDVRAVQMPGPLRARLRSGVHSFILTTSVAPSFDFAHWNYNDLYSGSWTAYAYADGTFTAP